MIDKGLYAAPTGEALASDMPIEIEIENPDSVTIGVDGLEIELAPAPATAEDFNANLAEFLDEDALRAIAEEVSDAYETDLRARSDWEKTYQDGLDLLGLKIEERTEPWDGACGVYHPLLSEAAVRFVSETITEVMPASGPVKTKIVGRVTREKEDAAERVRDDMNYYLTEKMVDYRAEHERLLWNLAVAGSGFKKVYFDPTLDRPVALFVPPEDFVAPYGATDLAMAPRYAHRMKKTKNELRKLQVAGFYRDVDLGDPQADASEIEDSKSDSTGIDAASDDRYTIIEMHIDLDVPGHEDTDKDGNETGIELPYVVHMDKGTGTILAVYRNWEETDPNKLRRTHFSQYTYVPGFGFYGMGLVHLVGGFAKSATSVLRQLVDAGSLSNLPGGLKARGLRIKGDDTPIAPGEFRDVDVPSGTIRDNILPLPYKEPSGVLYSLLENIVGEGRRFAAVADVNVADMQPNAPVGSTLAVLERTLKTMSAIQARVHAAMKCEFRIIKEIVKNNTDDDYNYDADAPEGRKAKRADYDIVEIIPVSDPNASTMSQRIAQYQAVQQLSQTAPQLYDLPLLHRQMVEALGVRNADKLVPMKDDIKPADPVSENMALLRGEPIKAFAHQDHDAHVAAHMSFGEDPKIMAIFKMHPNGQAIIAAGMAHIAEHVAFSYRNQIEQQLGVPLPTEENLPDDVEVNLSRLVAQAAQKLLQKNQSEAQQQQVQQQMQDPVIQMQMQELQIKQAEQQRKIQKDMVDAQLEQQRLQIERERIASAEKAAGAQIGAKLVAENVRASTQEKISGLQAGIAVTKSSTGLGA